MEIDRTYGLIEFIYQYIDRLHEMIDYII